MRASRLAIVAARTNTATASTIDHRLSEAHWCTAEWREGSTDPAIQVHQ